MAALMPCGRRHRSNDMASPPRIRPAQLLFAPVVMLLVVFIMEYGSNLEQSRGWGGLSMPSAVGYYLPRGGVFHGTVAPVSSYRRRGEYSRVGNGWQQRWRRSFPGNTAAVTAVSEESEMQRKPRSRRRKKVGEQAGAAGSANAVRRRRRKAPVDYDNDDEESSPGHIAARAKWAEEEEEEEVEEGTLMVHRRYGFCRVLRVEESSGNIILQFTDGKLLVTPDKLKGPGASPSSSAASPAPISGPLVTRYKQIGSSAASKDPELSSLRSTYKWDRKKQRVESSTLKLANDLMELYDERQKKTRTPSPPDDDRYRRFEENFQFEATPDQLKCFNDVREDMCQSLQPMDRLICGDVGYGKTEVAMRAIYRAICNGKQAALLVPSTILAQQHFKSFRKRMPDVAIDLLTGKAKASEAREIRERIASGETQLLVGTHSLLSENNIFNNLGLLVVDEEQRFGVAQKEAIKSRLTTIDVLTLSATPIPRTLQLSFVGLRDISLLRTAPKGRQKVETTVGEISVTRIRKAMLRELQRGGQVLFVVPRKKNIERVVESIEKMVPGIRVTTAYGGLTAIDDNMNRFAKREFDVLVATTIVEIGLDLPKANTIIVNHAQLFGISELHQLRGRVGRRDEKGYALFFTPPRLNATRDMKLRLEAIATATTGKEIAETDMKIRGAGSILGKDQSGSVGDVGYELYMQMVEEAVRDLHVVSLAPSESCDVSGLLSRSPIPDSSAIAIPESYIPNPTERSSELIALVNAPTSRRLLQVGGRLERSFGPHPPELATMIRALLLALVLRRLAVSSATYDTLRNRVVLKAEGLQLRHWEALFPRIDEKLRDRVRFRESRGEIYVRDVESLNSGQIVGQLLMGFIPVTKFLEDTRSQLEAELVDGNSDTDNGADGKDGSR